MLENFAISCLLITIKLNKADELLDYLSENRGYTEIYFLRMEDNLKELVRDIASKNATKRFVLGEICESWRMLLMGAVFSGIMLGFSEWQNSKKK